MGWIRDNREYKNIGEEYYHRSKTYQTELEKDQCRADENLQAVVFFLDIIMNH